MNMLQGQTTTWSTLPEEMRLAVIDHLKIHDVSRVASINHSTYALCLPTLFRVVKLRSVEALHHFMATVPVQYRAFIRELDICTKPAAYEDIFHYRESSTTGTLVTLLNQCTNLERLTLFVGGSMDNSIVPAFERLERLTRLSLSSWAEEDIAPLSERLVVALAFAVPRLADLAIARVTRSQQHAPELFGADPYVPLATGDAEVPSHPLLGDDLRLPALLRLPHLTRLRIRDTHLGDSHWAAGENDDIETHCCAPLEVLDLGSCIHVSPEFNQMCTERILANVPSTIKSFSLSTSLAPPSESESYTSIPMTCPTPSTRTSLSHLRTLHLTPLVPPSALCTTLAQPQLAASPVHTLACTFHPDDAAEGCAALAAFLADRAAQTPRSSISSAVTPGYPALSNLNVTFAHSPDDDDGDESAMQFCSMFTAGSNAALEHERAKREATTRLRTLCRELGLAACIQDSSSDDEDDDCVPFTAFDPFGSSMDTVVPQKGRARAKTT